MPDATIDHLVITAEPNRLIIRTAPQEYWLGFVFCLIFGPVFGLLGGWLAVGEMQNPGKFASDVWKEQFGLALDLQNPPQFILALSLALFAIAVLLVLAAFCLRELFLKIRYGRRPWIFDRSGDQLSVGLRELRTISSIDDVLIARLWAKWSYRYYVTLAPGPRPVKDTLFIGLRDDVFTFGSEESAERLARQLAESLSIGVVKGY